MKNGVSLLIYKAAREVSLDYALLVGKIGMVFLLFIFLISNISLSQKIHPLYYRVMDEKKDAVVLFLRKIELLPQYSYFLDLNSNIFGPKLSGEVRKDTITRHEKIQSYKNLLSNNPSSRDLLFALSQLYYEDGQMELARSYLNKAKNIDPFVR